MTGEEGWTNPQIVVNGTLNGGKEREATPIGRDTASREANRARPQIFPGPLRGDHTTRLNHNQGEPQGGKKLTQSQWLEKVRNERQRRTMVARKGQGTGIP